MTADSLIPLSDRKVFGAVKYHLLRASESRSRE
jgi:hypothetical protein